VLPRFTRDLSKIRDSTLSKGPEGCRLTSPHLTSPHRLDMWASYRGGAAKVWALIRGTKSKAGSTPASQRIFFRVRPVPEHRTANGGVTLLQPQSTTQPQRDIGHRASGAKRVLATYGHQKDEAPDFGEGATLSKTFSFTTPFPSISRSSE
jgi:hypothetical protein